MAIKQTTEIELDSHQLDIGSLKDVVDALRESNFPSHRWFPFGLHLGLLYPTLSEIEANHKNDVERCLHECLTKWLSRADKVDENGGPTVKSLVDALKKIGEVATGLTISEVLKDMLNPACRLLQKHFGKLSTVCLPSKVSQMLYMEGVISKETFDQVERSRGILTNGPLRALSGTVSEDPKQLRKFATVLQKSEDTICEAKDILKEYDQALSQVTLESTYQSDFDQMRVTFGNLLHTVAPIIAKSIPSLQELKTYLRRCFRELKPQLSIAKSFDDVMELVEEKCTIINVVCLEAIINTFDITEAKQHIKDYKTAVDKFCAEVRLSLCENQSFLLRPSTHLKCETVEFVLEWEPDDYSLSEIRDLLQKAFKDMARRVQVRAIRRGNSIIVTCYAPRNIINLLLKEAEDNIRLLKKIGLLKLSIGNYIVWDGQKRDKEIKELEKASSEKDQLIKELKSSLEEHVSTQREEHNQSPTEALSAGKLKLLDRMSKAKTLEIEQLSRYKETSDKLLVDKQEEIETLQEKITSLTLQLKEREENISQLMENMKALQSQMLQSAHDPIHHQLSQAELTSQKEPPSDDKPTQGDGLELVSDDKKFNEKSQSIQQESSGDHLTKDFIKQRDAETAMWSNDRVTLISPSMEECEEVMTQLKRKQETKWRITLWSSCPECLLIVFSNINECMVRRLDIENSALDIHCVSKLSNVLTHNKTMEALRLNSSPLPPNTLQYLTSAVSTNSLLETLVFSDDDNITDKDIPYICQMLTINKSLKILSFRCSNVTKYRKLSRELNKNKTLSSFYINGHYLR